jgi:diguanylate cyclase (GGDEF)-like protein/PAS domain S-box-containing protein
MPSEQSFVTQVQVLTNEFVIQLPDVWGEIETNWTRIWREGWTQENINPLRNHVHKFSGTSASLGFEQISRAAGLLQVALSELSFTETTPLHDNKQIEHIEALMQSLRHAVYTDQQVNMDDLTQALTAARMNSGPLELQRAKRLIFMVEDDETQAAELAAQVGYFGYDIQVFHTLSDLEIAIQKTMPTIILMDVSFPEGQTAGYEKIADLRSRLPKIPPVIFVTINDQMPYRLQAVRVGGEAYFTKPVDVSMLIDVLDRLIFQETSSPSRVMIVDDSVVQSKYTARVLNKSGISTEIVTDPLNVIDRMITFNPDLLLLDMYMPDCTGMELAKVIRQMEQFISIPIVYLSSETDKEKQLAAMELGGDDFLVKPIDPEHLISAVTSRIDRYRKLRELMVRDGLTGLLNHTTTKERLAQELVRANRLNEPLSYAMIDLDFFKLVNDTYGHSTGDRVLKSLAHLFNQRLRRSDIIGRVGGEEFGIIFPNTREDSAQKIMNELCEGFSKIRHHSGEVEFKVTFSCGIASYPNCETIDAICNTADAALYAAKASGKNHVKSGSCLDGNIITPDIAFSSPKANCHEAPDEKLAQNLLRHANSFILQLNPKGIVTYANESALTFFGYPDEELVGHSIFDTIIPDERDHNTDLRTMFNDILDHPDRYTKNENENICKNGKSVWVVWSNTPVIDEQGNLIEIMSIGNDITDRKHTEANLNRTIARLSALNRIANTTMNQTDYSSMMMETMKEISDLFNAFNVEIALLDSTNDVIHLAADYKAHWSTLGQENLSNENFKNYPLVLKDRPDLQESIDSGKAIFISDSHYNPFLHLNEGEASYQNAHSVILAPLTGHGKNIGIMIIAFDQPDRQVYTNELELSETIAGYVANVIEISTLFAAEQRQRQYFEALVHHIPTAIVIMDMNAKILSWNPAAETLFGFTTEEAVGQDFTDLLVTDEFMEEALRNIDRTLHMGQSSRAITRRHRKDGSLADVELVAVPISMNHVQFGSLTIYHDISELVKARRDAEAANKAKSAFLATMSHEIRTPLNAVVGMTTLLLDTSLTDEQREFSETIRNSSDALLSIINDILDYSKIEADRMELEEQSFDLRECVESALDLAAANSTHKKIDLAYIIETNVPPVIIGDSTRLRQIMLNLLSNAVKFTTEGEVVLKVSVDQEHGPAKKPCKLHFTVHDTGIGISHDRMDRLFQSFSQVDASTTRKYGGTGLGLAISKRLAEMMGGRMWVESEGIPGKGSTFHFIIPVAPSDSPMPVFLNRRQPELAEKTVLIVDDNDTNRYILTRQVQSWGMKADETGSPHQALEWVKNGRIFDLGLLDMQMPEMDGITLATEIQKLPGKTNDFPVIILTSLGSKETEPGSAKLAANLTKPIKPSVLYSTLLSVLGTQPVLIEHILAEKPVIKPAEPLPPLRILLAEDVVVNQKVALSMLKRLGYRADVASNGLEVLEAIRRQPYDVIFMDIQMPEMDGMEATRQIRSGDWMKQTVEGRTQPYIVAMTANAMEGDRELCIKAGMDDYISKPIHPEDIVKAFKKIKHSDPSVGSHSPAPSPKTKPATSVANQDLPDIDEGIFNDFQVTMGGDGAEALIELIQDFQRESSQFLDELHQGVDHGDAEHVRRASHSIKSSSMLFGALKVAEICKLIESEAVVGNLTAVASQLPQLDGSFQLVRAYLKQRVDVMKN